MDGCEHLIAAGSPEPVTADGCQECLATGGSWMQLRLCLTCGHVGCCDSSKGKHARKHASRQKHPVIRSFHSGDEWRWCYVDQAYG